MPINLTGPICSTGYGVVATNLLKSLDAVGAEPALFPLGQIDLQSWKDDHALLERCLRRASRFDPDAPSLKVWHQFDMSASVGRGKRVGYCFTELDRLKPIEVHHLNSLDLVVQPSGWAMRVAGDSGVTTPQVVIPPAVDTEIFFWDNLPDVDETVFVSAGKWEYRKGHDIVLQAFLRAFKPDDKVKLIMVCHNPFLDAHQGGWPLYYSNHPLKDKVEIIGERLETQRDVAGVFRRGHCGIFPARAEGANLEAMELLAMGRHAIMTDYSGHTEYLAACGAEPIRVGGLEPAHDGVWFDQNDPEWLGELPATSVFSNFGDFLNPGKWAQLGPEQVESLAEKMVGIHSRRAAGGLRLNRSGVKNFEGWTWTTAAEKILQSIYSLN